MKEYKGYELIKAMENKEIEGGTKIYLSFTNEKFDMNKKMKFYTKIGMYRDLHLWREEEGKEDEEIRVIGTEDLTNNIFYVIEKETIDIDSIEEVNIKTKFTDYSTEITYIKIKYNELIKTVKQLNREIKELKENKENE